MVKYLSDEYLDRMQELAQDFPETPGATVRIQYVVTGAPEGDAKYYTVIENGKMTEAALGEDPQADATLTNTYDDAVKIAKGELDTNGAFMQGRIKVTGNMAKIMSLMPLTNKPEYKAIQQQLADETEF